MEKIRKQGQREKEMKAKGGVAGREGIVDAENEEERIIRFRGKRKKRKWKRE